MRRAVLAGVDGIEHGYGVSDSTLELMLKRNVYLVPTDLSYAGAIKIFKLEKLLLTHFFYQHFHLYYMK